MAKRRDLLLTAVHDELIKAKEEVARMFEALRTGQIGEKEFKRWWRTHVAFKGREILKDLIKRRERSRGWGDKTKSSS